MLQVKPGVQPPLIYLVAALANISEMYEITLTITSGVDGVHSEWSGHYQLRAVDVRTKDLPKKLLPELRTAIRQELSNLGMPFSRVYVEIHDPDVNNEHIHVQFK